MDKTYIFPSKLRFFRKIEFLTSKNCTFWRGFWPKNDQKSSKNDQKVKNLNANLNFFGYEAILYLFLKKWSKMRSLCRRSATYKLPNGFFLYKATFCPGFPYRKNGGFLCVQIRKSLFWRIFWSPEKNQKKLSKNVNFCTLNTENREFFAKKMRFFRPKKAEIILKCRFFWQKKVVKKRSFSIKK